MGRAESQMGLILAQQPLTLTMAVQAPSRVSDGKASSSLTAGRQEKAVVGEGCSRAGRRPGCPPEMEQSWGTLPCRLTAETPTIAWVSWARQGVLVLCPVA